MAMSLSNKIAILAMPHLIQHPTPHTITKLINRVDYRTLIYSKWYNR
jgi:hypothetical protein